MRGRRANRKVFSLAAVKVVVFRKALSDHELAALVQTDRRRVVRLHKTSKSIGDGSTLLENRSGQQQLWWR
jgi:hypothetical protein